MKWAEAVAQWNREHNKGGKYMIPRKGTDAYNAVAKMMGKEPSEQSAPKAPSKAPPAKDPYSERSEGSAGKKLRLNEMMGMLEAHVAEMTRAAAATASPAKRQDLEKKAAKAKRMLAAAKKEYAAL